MSQYVDTNTRTFTADAAIKQYARVVFESDGRIVTAGLTEVGCGIAISPAFEAGHAIAVKLWNSQGTFKMDAQEGFSVGARLYTEADGKVQGIAQATAVPFAQALENATADNDIIECVLLPYHARQYQSNTNALAMWSIGKFGDRPPIRRSA